MTENARRGSAGSEGAWRGVWLLAASAFMFSIMGVLVKSTGRRLPTEELILGRSAVALGLGWATVRTLGVSSWGRRRGLLVVRGWLGFGAMACFFYALTHMPLADATVIFYTGPIFTALLASALLAERVDSGVVIAALISIVGVAIIGRPRFIIELLDLSSIAREPGERSPITGLAVGAALAGAILAACSWVSVRALTRTEHPAVIVWYVPLIGTPIILLAALPGFVWPTASEWLALLAIGASAHTARIWFTRGMAIHTAGRSSTISSYLQVAFAVLWGAVLFAEIPDRYTLIGLGLIVVAMATVAVRTARRAVDTGARRR